MRFARVNLPILFNEARLDGTSLSVVDATSLSAHPRGFEPLIADSYSAVLSNYYHGCIDVSV